MELDFGVAIGAGATFSGTETVAFADLVSVLVCAFVTAGTVFVSEGTRQAQTVPFSRVRRVMRTSALLAAGWMEDFFAAGTMILSPISRLFNVETKPQGTGLLLDLSITSIIKAVSLNE